MAFTGDMAQSGKPYFEWNQQIKPARTGHGCGSGRSSGPMAWATDGSRAPVLQVPQRISPGRYLYLQPEGGMEIEFKFQICNWGPRPCGGRLGDREKNPPGPRRESELKSPSSSEFSCQTDRNFTIWANVCLL